MADIIKQKRGICTKCIYDSRISGIYLMTKVFAMMVVYQEKGVSVRVSFPDKSELPKTFNYNTCRKKLKLFIFSAIFLIQ